MANPIHCIFIGGPGRSGTTLVARGLAEHPAVASFHEVELKIFSELNGLLDLRETLTNQYSPTRAITAIRLFRDVFQALIDGDFGQAPLKDHGLEGAWYEISERFIGSLQVDGFPVHCSTALFDQAARRLVADLARTAADSRPGATSFMEKTPGNLLFADSIERFAPASSYVHVMRDPRAIAASLVRIPWGPDTIEASAQWVMNYSLAWQAATHRYAQAGLDVTEVYLEDIVAAPAVLSVQLSEAVGLSKAAGLFWQATRTPTDRPIDEIPERYMGYLTRTLADWLRFFGYSPEKVGVRVDI